jgi:hypothetical protein
LGRLRWDRASDPGERWAKPFDSKNQNYYLYKKQVMFQTKNTLHELVSLLEEMPQKTQTEMLRQLKLRKALQMARKIDSAKKPKLKISDQEIADIVHEHRKTTWKKR